MFFYRAESVLLWRRLKLYVPMTMTFNFLTKLVTFGVVLLLVIQGKLLRPEYIFPAIPLIKQFVGIIVMRLVVFMQMQWPEMLVVTGRIEV